MMKSIRFMMPLLASFLIAPIAQGNGLASHTQLTSGQSVSSPDGRFVLTMQADGNLVWSYGQRVAWSSGTYGTKDAKCVMQSDGNLVIYGSRDGKYRAVWSSNTFQCAGATLACQSDGNLVIYHQKKAVWSTNTFYPNRTDNTLALALRHIQCEQTTQGRPNDTSKRATDHLFIEVSDGKKNVKIRQEGKNDYISFRPGTGKQVTNDLFIGTLAEGQTHTLNFTIKNNSEWIRFKRIPASEQPMGLYHPPEDDYTFEIKPENDVIGEFQLQISQNKGIYSLTCKGKNAASYKDGTITCTGSDSKYVVQFSFDLYKNNQIQSLIAK